MADSESIKKMLRSVLQSSKNGVSITRLQSEYRSLCGESIPLKKLGHSNLEAYLRSIPSVVRLEYSMGEIQCFAAVCRETAHIAELVARQKSTKKSGHSQIVNCKMRYKPSNSYMLSVRPKSSLRQPSPTSASNWTTNRPRPHFGYGGFSAAGDYRQLDKRLSPVTPVEHRQPAHQSATKACVEPDRKEKKLTNYLKPAEKSPEQIPRPNQSQSNPHDVGLVERKLTQLLQKYCSGLWMSKLMDVYNEEFGEKLSPQVLKDIEKWTHICMVEKPSSNRHADCLIYPPLPPKPSAVVCSGATSVSPSSSTSSSTSLTPKSSRSSSPQRTTILTPPHVHGPAVSPKTLLAEPNFQFSPQSVASPKGQPLRQAMFRSPAHNPALAPQLSARVDGLVGDGGCKVNPNLYSTTNNQSTLPSAVTKTSPAKNNTPSQHDPDILPLLKVSFSAESDSARRLSAAAVSDEVRQRIKELLSKYSNGLWVHALPKLFMDTYKEPFPEVILDNLSVLLDTFAVEYPIPHDKKKAILYNYARPDTDTNSPEKQMGTSHSLPSGVEILGTVVPPCLVPPSDQYPSVLITDAKSSNAVTVRYVGEKYSSAQEAMEEDMLYFYSQSSSHHVSNPVVGQLVAVRGEDGDELARAQIIEVMAPNKAKIYYVDYGFSVEISTTNLLKLHPEYLSLPFQATNVKLAGLEAVSSHPVVLSFLEKFAVGTILLMETLEPCHQEDVPVAVLYDTSQDEDININSICLKALWDKTMNHPLTINKTYQDVCVTNVCADGTIYCQLPSRGTARLSKLLEETEALFSSQMTSESLVSRPFTGKFCLVRYKGKWSRVEITNTFGIRVMEVLYIDLGIQATVEITDLRKMPPVFIRDFCTIPPQAIKCRLADVPVPEGDWSSEACLWLKTTLMSSLDCKMKILKLEEQKEDLLVHAYLFVGADGQELDKSINHQLAQSEVWQKLISKNNKVPINNTNVDIGLSALVEKMSLSSPVPNPIVKATIQPHHGDGDSSVPDKATTTGMQPLSMPPPLVLPQSGQNMDVFVPVACHPGYFVLQPWQDLHKLVVLMGEMILYYNQTSKSTIETNIQKGEVYAAKIDKNWHRVQVKGILANGFVSVFELDYGKHELVRSSVLQPLIEEFRQLPFQAITAQLAGVTQHQWTEEASMLFRTHVEGRALVAQVESVQEVSGPKGELSEHRLTVYLVDTTSEERDIWIHNLMADVGGELSSAA